MLYLRIKAQPNQNDKYYWKKSVNSFITHIFKNVQFDNSM